MLTESQKTKLADYKNSAAASTKAKERLIELFDDGVYTEINSAVKAEDAAVVTAYGYVDGSPVYAFSQDKSVNNGAVTKSVAAKICKVYELASRNGVPVVGIFDSNGAVVTDGADAIAAYSEILAYTNNLSGVVPQIAVIAGTCVGSAALIAASSDFVAATEDSAIYLIAGEGKNGADAAKLGGVSVLAKDDAEAVKSARDILSLLPANNLAVAPEFEYTAPSKAADGKAADVAEALADEGSVIELSKEFGKASYTALATLGGSVVGIAATNKTADKLTSDDSSKLARFVRTCDAFSVPVVTVIDTEGFETDDNIRDLAKLANAYAEATTVKVSVVTGNAIGSAMVALGTANADMTFAYPNAVISPVAPVTAAEFLYHDKLKGAADVKAERNRIAAEYAENEASAFAAAEKGCVDAIITSDEARAKIQSVLELMAGKRLNKRLPKKHSNMPF
ncbi:MAG: carboxyl transferase domain-containing protein [Oscillospiraceae bacterium]